jgi:hypothetical protein
MEQKRAERLREQWENKKCDHPEIVREYQYGIATKMYVCITCGNEFNAEEYIKARKPRPGMGRPAKFYETA